MRRKETSSDADAASNAADCSIKVDEILRISGQQRNDHVYEIDLHGKRIRRISDLESFSRLRSLDLSCNKIRKIENLTKSTGLKELKVYSNEIRTIEGLDRLRDLCCLMLQYNRIASIGTGLKHLTRLQLLRLDFNCLTSVAREEIVSLSQLTYLDLSSNQISKVEGLSALTNLEELGLGDNQLVAVPDIVQCKKLQEIDLSGNHLKSLTGLSSLPRLRTLRLERLSLSSVASLGHLRSLENFYLANNKIEDATALSSQCPLLELLDVKFNQLKTTESLAKFPRLTDFYVEGNPLAQEPNYRADIARAVPSVELIDGVQVNLTKKAENMPPPVMRPMTATTVISTKQIESQISALDLQMELCGSSLDAKLDVFAASLSSLSTIPEPESEAQATSRPSTRSSSRARIMEAKAFANRHFQKDKT